MMRLSNQILYNSINISKGIYVQDRAMLKYMLQLA